MSTTTFDTFKFVERLEKAGATRELAAALVEVQKETIAEAMDNQLATKTDIRALKDEIKADIAPMRTDLAVLKWMMGVLIAIAIANFAKQYF